MNARAARGDSHRRNEKGLFQTGSFRQSAPKDAANRHAALKNEKIDAEDASEHCRCYRNDSGNSREQSPKSAGKENNAGRPEQESLNARCAPHISKRGRGSCCEGFRRQGGFRNGAFPAGNHNDNTEGRKDVQKEDRPDPRNRYNEAAESRTNGTSKVELNPIQGKSRR